MAKYLVQANYINEGVKGLLKDGGTARRAVVDKLLASMGGQVEAFYYAFGDSDLILIVDLPDNVSMAASALTVAASGAIALKTTVLLTSEEIDAAAKKSPLYSAPGR